MSRATPQSLTPFSYLILALVGRGGAGPHDIVRMMREGAIFWTTSESHFYAEPKRLAKLGFLHARKEPGRTRPRTHYELTDAGRRALSQWLALPAAMPRIQHEGIVKLLAADFSDDARRPAQRARARLSEPAGDGATRALGAPPRPVPAADRRLRATLARRPTRVARRRATRVRSALADNDPPAKPIALAEAERGVDRQQPPRPATRASWR
jgi:DNA-binding PadR family transcriptional regulator